MADQGVVHENGPLREICALSGGTLQFYEGESAPTALGAEGESPRWIPASTELTAVGKVPGRGLVPYDIREPRDIGWSTVRKFKGLESPVVILVELDKTVVASQRVRELAYVGVARAQDYLFVIGGQVRRN